MEENLVRKATKRELKNRMSNEKSKKKFDYVEEYLSLPMLEALKDNINSMHCTDVIMSIVENEKLQNADTNVLVGKRYLDKNGNKIIGNLKGKKVKDVAEIRIEVSKMISACIRKKMQEEKEQKNEENKTELENNKEGKIINFFNKRKEAKDILDDEGR